MNVSVAGYQSVSILHGGPYAQIRGTAAALARKGVRVSFFDPWKRFDASRCDLFHLFAANIGTFHLAREVHTLGVPLVVSPIIYSRHSPSFIRLSLGATRLAQRGALGLWSDYIFASDVCRWADHVVPNTRAEAELVIRGLGVDRSRVTVVPNGVDRRFERATPALFRKKYGMSGFILNVGHTGHGRKNVLRLIRALATIDHPAVIIGRIVRGPYGDACVREAARHKHIRLIDGLDHDSPMLASAYSACDTFVLPSLFETPGIAALEAGLTGAKIVITPYGGTDEYFGNMADYVDPLSVESIRSGILAALHRPRTGALKEHIRKNFLWEHAGARTAEVYRALLDRGRK